MKAFVTVVLFAVTELCACLGINLIVLLHSESYVMGNY